MRRFAVADWGWHIAGVRAADAWPIVWTATQCPKRAGQMRVKPGEEFSDSIARVKSRINRDEGGEFAS